ncbi:DedA family protein [Pragia fontium]|uniref:Membrane protein DedA, SNARE-associated domain n=2 Tax=Pragia fontium TaxID=82985 RepID=A0AAJ5BI20_9GAMM|nr:DedA family protein [Pragia fontium]AKJ40833.1 cytochrome O ubiquinol oxidase [Pragia fontium]SFD17461.1 membrane protein DedA, SNARE-associated domain [Pragia fontium DSM 5563 = ATCC 49100]SUB81014.1 Inner membrane protein yabI [Pragia fontium]VEJ52869.1 Inner membrane protein yabI [Pragia fontium]GKX64356.1 cytochrome o ubiquinol oxidase [Pragia fontium]
MTLDHIISLTMNFVRNHQVWGPPIVFFLAFGESIAFLSLLIPATVILIGIGAIIGESGITFWPLWVAASAGAFFGDWISYWFGRHYKEKVAEMWPLSRNPQMLVRGQHFFDRWGTVGVFIGRFFGPLRATVPLVAGICDMPSKPFQAVNLSSAILWGFLMLAPGAFGLQWITHYLSF